MLKHTKLQFYKGDKANGYIIPVKPGIVNEIYHYDNILSRDPGTLLPLDSINIANTLAIKYLNWFCYTNTTLVNIDEIFIVWCSSAIDMVKLYDYLDNVQTGDNVMINLIKLKQYIIHIERVVNDLL
jgi:hypothetical protein